MEGSGRTYILTGKMDPVEKAIKVQLDANGLDYEVDLDFNDKANEYELEVAVNLGASGAYKVEMELEKDYSGAGIKVRIFAKPNQVLRLYRCTKTDCHLPPPPPPSSSREGR